MTFTLTFLTVVCAVAIGVALATPMGFQRPTRSKLQVRAQEACCGDLGCFSAGGAFFDLLNRPINSVPNCALTNKLKLHLNTRRNPVTTQVIDPYDTAAIVSSNFVPTRKTVLIIHGFLDNFQWPWWKETVKEMLADGDYNIVRLDWSHGNTIPYTQASANVRLVGAYGAKFLLHLRDQYGVDPATMHVVGHSLGAHGAGYVGMIMRQNNASLGRITGLDPAGPYFHNMPAEVTLDPTDATFVDTIVTDGEGLLNLGFGTSQPMGHINFYPNGGINQPGCEDGLLSTLWNGPSMNSTNFDFLGSLAATGFEAVACNHARAPVLFYESINNKPCSMKSFECTDFFSFLNGDCFKCAGGKCATLGWHVETDVAEHHLKKKYYTITTEKSPFCTYPHKLTFTLQNKSKDNDAKTRNALVYVTLIGAQATSRKIQLNPEAMDLVPGQTYTFFFESFKELGDVQSIVFWWDNRPSILNPINWIKTVYLYLEGDIYLTEIDELVSVFQPSRNKVEEKKDMNSQLVHSYQQ